MKNPWIPMICALWACGPAVEPPGSPGTSSQGSGTMAGDSSTSGTTNPDSSGATDDDGPAADTTGAVTSAGFIDDPEDVGPLFDCSMWAQDCPAGQKCTPWASDGGGETTSYRCVPIVDDPAQTGEPCTIEGDPLSGLDTCDLGGYCFNVDPETGEGVCYDLCVGSDSRPTCDDPDAKCRIEVSGTRNLCYPKCDPLAQDCPEGQGCYSWSPLMICAPDASEGMGAPGEPCEFINVCIPGNVCLNPTVSTATCLDQGAIGCCIPFCDVNEPMCTEGETCLPWYEPGDEDGLGYEHVGFCTTM